MFIMRVSIVILLTVVYVAVSGQERSAIIIPAMMFGDRSRTGTPFSKDPHVIRFQGKYLMYYSVQPYSDKSNPVKGWGIGIAMSNDLINWEKIGEITPSEDYESKGLCAPCARLIDGTIHLFYQTYGNGKNDAICHAWSSDGIYFTRDPSNPVFHPEGAWTCGRAIDAEDIKNILVKNPNLDFGYIRKWLGEFSQIPESKDALSVFEKILKDIQDK